MAYPAYLAGFIYDDMLGCALDAFKDEEGMSRVHGGSQKTLKTSQ